MGAWRGTGGLLLWIDIDPALQREADAWYLDEHLPERVEIAGYRSARRYVAIDAVPRYLSIFEADTPQALAGAGYLGLVRNISEQSRRIRAGFRNVARNTFSVLASAGRARGGVVASLRLNVDPAAPVAEAEAALAASVPKLVAAHGVVAVHALKAAPEIRAQLDAVRAVGQQDAAVPWALMVEATQAEELAALRAGPLSDAALANAGWRVDVFGTYRLMAEFS